MGSRPQFKTYNKPAQGVSKSDNIEIIVQDFLGGLFTDADTCDIPDNCVQSMTNGIYLRNQFFRRNGLAAYSIAEPNSNKILGVYVYSNGIDPLRLYRFTKNTIHRAVSSAWTSVTGTALNSTDSDCYSIVTADQRLFFSNNGADEIQEIDLGANTYAQLGNAPRYKYITSAFNRIIGAFRKDTTDVPYEIGWCGDLNYGEWDPSVDISAGITPLVDSPSDLSDPITGLFSLESCICITRERSIWLGINQPSATNPFFFFASVPRIGADTPKTIKVTKESIIFYSYKDATVYEFFPDPNSGNGNGRVVSLSDKIKRFIKNTIGNNDPNTLLATMNYDTNSYSLLIPAVGGGMFSFTYNRDLQAWSNEFYFNMAYAVDLDIPKNKLTDIFAAAPRIFGSTDGKMYTQYMYAGFSNELGFIAVTDAGQITNFVVKSKDFTSLPRAQTIEYLQIVITPYNTGSIVIAFNKVKGTVVASTDYKSIAITSSMLTKKVVIICKRPIRCNTYRWEITSSNCMFSIDSFSVIGKKSGLATQTL